MPSASSWPDIMIDRVGITARLYVSASRAGASAAVGHGLVHSVHRHGAGPRMLLGVGEAGNFPAAIKTVVGVVSAKGAKFRHRSFSTPAPMSASFSPPSACPSSSPTGAGGPASLITGAIGVFVLVLRGWPCTASPEDHPKLSPRGAGLYPAGWTAGGGGWRSRSSGGSWSGIAATWAFAVPKFMTDAIWWFYLTWLPTFFNEQPGVSRPSST
jgi:ACS family hexuronate transporter-like MFS transporter